MTILRFLPGFRRFYDILSSVFICSLYSLISAFMDLKALIRDIPDFPKPGILFRDITTLLSNPKGLRYTIDLLAQKSQEAGLTIDYVVGMESRGFIFGTPLAYKIGAGFIPVRKPGKLPSAVHSVDYQLEYGTDRLEIHQDALQSGDRVLIVDDLIATGGTASATAQLLQKIGCELVGFGFIIELRDLNGRKHLPDVPIISLVEY
jgi:adenine phosphoribosyltransferase